MGEYTDKELRDIIENEGFSYAVQDYLDPDSIEDGTTKKLWADAKEALDKLAKHLKLDEEDNE